MRVSCLAIHYTESLDYIPLTALRIKAAAASDRCNLQYYLREPGWRGGKSGNVLEF